MKTRLTNVSVCICKLNGASFANVANVTKGVSDVFYVVDGSISGSSSDVYSMGDKEDTIRCFGAFSFNGVSSDVNIVSVRTFTVFRGGRVVVERSVRARYYPRTINRA